MARPPGSTPLGPEAGPAGAGARFRASGQVQGVGFRPFIHRVATGLGLGGAVWNHDTGVTAEVWGSPQALDAFERAVPATLPPLAELAAWEREALAPPAGAPPSDFRILASRRTGAGAPRRVAVDTAPCAACLAEIADGRDRRYRHPFVNCTDCGPRYTIVRDLPYDRARTSMAGFPLCPDCAREFADPTDRRFHAQPVCCPACGPTLAFLLPGSASSPTRGAEALEAGVRLLATGRILAVKGVGGYHLAVSASDEAAVRRLRERKGRDAKPFAVMVLDLDAAARLARLDPRARDVLTGPAAPIVLAPVLAQLESTSLAPSVAPGLDRVGVMLPSSPLHHLLCRAVEVPLVMTSGNRTDEPLIRDDPEALEHLTGIADGFLVHDRPIVRAVDDSVVLSGPAGGVLPLRRARGMVPGPIPLPRPPRTDGIAMGGDLKGAVALVQASGAAILSQHLGDLTHPAALRRARQTVLDLVRIHRAQPRWIAVDLHPAYLSRRLGLELARAWGGPPLPVVQVQHHHAHLASLLAEHDRAGPIVAVVADGVGYGADGTAWGGEILVGDLAGAERVGHLRPLRLPGGDAAAVETDRCALSWLADALGEEAHPEHPWARRVVPDARRRGALWTLLERDLNAPTSTGLGRLFDAAAALVGICRRNRYEARSGQLLEAAARRSTTRPSGGGVVGLELRAGPFQLDVRPLAIRLCRGVESGYLTEDLAWFFHDAVADALVRGAERAARQAGVETVGLTGGVFCNELLAGQVVERLEARGLEVLTHRVVPPNDGGIALGQAAVAAVSGRSSTDQRGTEGP